jgi:hypothetical protein
MGPRLLEIMTEFLVGFRCSGKRGSLEPFYFHRMWSIAEPVNEMPVEVANCGNMGKMRRVYSLE